MEEDLSEALTDFFNEVTSILKAGRELINKFLELGEHEIQEELDHRNGK